MKRSIVSIILSIFLVFSFMPEPTALAEVLSPYESVENNGDGVTTYHNKDGSITLEVALTDDQIQSMLTDEPDRLKESSSGLVGVDKKVDVSIKTELNEEETLASAVKDGMSVSFYPVIDVRSEPEEDRQEEARDDSAEETPEPEDIITQEESVPASGEEDATEEGTDGDIPKETDAEVEEPDAAAEADDEDNPDPSDAEEKEPEITEAGSDAAETIEEDALPAEDHTAEDASSEETEPGMADAVPLSDDTEKEDQKPERETGVKPAEKTEPAEGKEETEEPQEPVSIKAERQGYSGGTYASLLFEDVFGSADMELSALRSGIKENVIIGGYESGISFSYKLRFRNMNPKQNGKRIDIYDKDGGLAAKIAAPFMKDANGGYSEDIAVSFEYAGDGEYLLTYTPSERWLKSDRRSFPVVMDPSITYESSDTYGIEDNYVTSTSPGTNHTYNATSFKVGNDGNGVHTAYIRPVIPDSLADNAGNVIIKSASVKMYENTGKSGGSTYSIHQVTGGSWDSRTITYNNAPGYASKKDQTKSINGGGWVTWDITEMFSSWFNALDQKGNYGFALTADTNSSGNYREFASADTPTHRLTYSVTYFLNPDKPTPTATVHGNGTNSGTGYIDLSWSAAEGADSYYVGIFNGKEYEYFYVNTSRSFTTHNKGIWPTTSEINSGRYALHGDGSGTELPMIPALTYRNAGSAYASDLNYYIKVIPANSYGQAIDPGKCSAVSKVLPDTVPPNQASKITVSPSVYTNAGSIGVSWSGITDYTNTSGSAQTTLSGGVIQYNIDNGTWNSTGKNTASGTYSFSTSGLADGQHVVYIRGKDAAGNTGSPRGVNFYIDKTGPTAPTLSVSPSSWTKGSPVSLTWSGISDLNNLSKVEYNIDGGSWKSTGKTNKSYSGYSIDLSSLTSGTHTVYVRGVDTVGNNGKQSSVKIYKDVDVPILESLTAEPPSWTNEDEITLFWSGLKDVHSGLKSAVYTMDDEEEETTVEPLDEDLSFPFDMTCLSDGEHILSFTFSDNLDNTFKKQLSVFRDATDPETALHAPSDGDIVNGTVEIWGSVSDISLEEWVLSATGSNGSTVEINRGTEIRENELMGVLNSGLFEDGEEISITLSARDLAGNESSVSGVVIKVDKSARPLNSDVAVTAPESGEKITSKIKTGQYSNEYEGQEDAGYYYIDGEYIGKAEDQAFGIDAITYAEDSLHSFSVISKDENGDLHYSKGLSAYMMLSDSFLDETYTEGRENIKYTGAGAVLTSDTGEIVFKEVSSPKDIMALRLNAIQVLPEGSGISYYYSIDGGETWEEIIPGRDVVPEINTKKVKLKAVFTAEGEMPSLPGIELESVIEMSPLRASVKLLRKANDLTLNSSTVIEKAIFPVSNAKADEKAVYLNGYRVSDSFDLDARDVREDTSCRVSAAGIRNGDIYACGADALILQRKNLDAEGTAQSGKLTASSDIYAVRLVALGDERIKYYCSPDSNEWLELKHDEYLLLPKTTKTVYVKAEIPGGSVLRAWHIEGVTAKAKTYRADLVREPQNVTAADWGGYYDKQKDKKYVITWTDANKRDNTADSRIFFEVFRNGKLIGTTDQLTYTDTEYVAGAVYTVKAVREYTEGAYPVRVSGGTAAEYTKIQKEQKIDGVRNILIDVRQSDYLSELYGGGYTFSTEPNAPTGERALSRKLLGKSKYCSIGFEPINFNTGNFMLETQDIFIPGDIDIDITRTYNALSEAGDGPFGSKWEFPYSSHLIIYENGDIGYRRADGSEIQFYKGADGTYTGNDDDDLKLSADETGMVITVKSTDGSVQAFSRDGFLAYTEDRNGNRVSFDRDERGVLTAIHEGDRVLTVGNDADGHITAITTPEGNVHSYEYDGRYLVSYTDPNGNVTRYVYDGQGRMTEWYDGNGARQVLNEYDSEDRVVHQTDANGGEYTIEYFSDHTVTTDASGTVNEIWFDSEKRTVKQVDGNGGSTLYSYDENGRMDGTTDESGRLTSYEYNENGDKITDISPDGSEVTMEYDGDHNLTKLTDQLGNETNFEYDDKGNAVRQINPDGSERSYEYDDNGNVVKTVDENGSVTTAEYMDGNLVRETDALGNISECFYDRDGRMIRSVNALGDEMNYEYDPAGNLLMLTFSDDTKVRYSYDAAGSRTSVTDPKGNTTRYTYDPMRQLTETILPDGSKQTSEYDAALNNTSVTDANGVKTEFEYDKNGNKVSEKDGNGNVTGYEYDEQNRLVREILPTGAAREYEYDDITGLLIKSVSASGKATTYEYDRGGHLIRENIPGGGVISYEYDSMGRKVSEKDASGGVTRFEYDAAGNLISQTDPKGGRTEYEYDAAGNVVKATDPAGGTFFYEYDKAGRLSSETNALGGKTTYEYDNTGDLIKTEDAAGGITKYEYDDNGNVLNMTDAMGGTVSYEYDKNGNAVKITDPNGGVSRYEYDGNGNIVKATDALGNETRYSYDKAGNAVKVTDALGQSSETAYNGLGLVSSVKTGDSTVSYEYDKAGRIIYETDANGIKTEYSYDSADNISKVTVNGNTTEYVYSKSGNLLSMTDAEGREIRFCYDSAGNRTRVIYPNGTEDRTEYDAAGRILRETPEGSPVTEYAYDAAGNITSVKTGDKETSYVYDKAGRLLKTVNPDGSEETYSYDLLSNVTGITDALGNTVGYEFDSKGAAVGISYPNGSRAEFIRDLNGNVIKDIYPDGSEKEYEYDALGRIKSVTDALGAVSEYEYDILGNVTKSVNANGSENTFGYDNAGNLTRETDALGNTVQYSYTPEGWLDTVTKADGKVIKYSYDKTGNILSADNAGESSVSYSYNETGQVVKTEGEEGATEYQYDSRGQLVKVTQPEGENVQYAYDSYGRKASLTYPDGRTVGYTYDDMYRLVSVKGLDGTETVYEYDAAGRRIKTSDGSLTTEYSYDDMGNILEQATTGKTDISFRYTYDQSNRMLSEERTENGASVKSSYAYDKAGQITSFSRSDGYRENYSYDPAGNMLIRQIGDTRISMSYNAADQLEEMSSENGTIRYDYDRNGSLIKKTMGDRTDSYTYDALGQLKTYTGHDGYQVKYRYDPQGMLKTKETKGNTDRLTFEEIAEGKKDEDESGDDDPDPEEWIKTDYVYDSTMQFYNIIMEKTGEKTVYYDYGLERIAAHSSAFLGSYRTAYVYDGRGSVAQEVGYNNSWYTLGGVISPSDIQSKAYTPYGEQINTKTSGYGYNGEYYDAATGMVDLRARSYEPAMNRFSQKDSVKGSLSNPISQNSYLYVWNDPVNLFDLSGWNVWQPNITNRQLEDWVAKNPSVRLKDSTLKEYKTQQNIYKKSGIKTVVNNAKVSDSIKNAQRIIQAQLLQKEDNDRTKQIMIDRLVAENNLQDIIELPTVKCQSKDEQLRIICEAIDRKTDAKVSIPAIIYDYNVANNSFVNAMMNQYGFSRSEAILLYDAYNKYEKDSRYARLDNLTKIHAFYSNMAALLSDYSSNIPIFYVSANNPSTEEAVKFFNSFDVDGESLKRITTKQHIDNKTKSDFLHEAATISVLSNASLLKEMAKLFSSDIDDLSGYKGDIYSGEGSIPDIKADIAAVNLYNLFMDSSSTNIMNSAVYYSKMTETKQVQEFLFYFGDGDLSNGYDVVLSNILAPSIGALYLGRTYNTAAIKKSFDAFDDYIQKRMG